MRLKQQLYGFFAAVGILVLIFDGQTALEGARQGIDLCTRIVIPSLFPFFLLSCILTSALFGTSFPPLRLLGRLCHVPPGSESLLIPGFLGGYPVGAQTVSNAYHSGQLTKYQANRLLSFCSNAGPAFLFGMVSAYFPGIAYPFLLWLIQLISAVAVSIILPFRRESDIHHVHTPAFSLSDMMKRTLIAMATVCGWVVTFRILICFLDKWCLWMLPKEINTVISGILELTNGCTQLDQIEHIGLRFIVCSGIVSFGGLCVTLQTASVIGTLSLKSYFSGKLLQTIISIILSFLFQMTFSQEKRVPGAMPIAAVCIESLSVFLLFRMKMRKNSSNPAALGV